jgi:hypothetical protein
MMLLMQSQTTSYGLRADMLFLAEIQLETCEYGGSGDNRRGVAPTTWRLVEADDESHARDKVYKACEISDPYGTSVSVRSVQIHKSI